jgi:16S rRNA (guanine527-N7)-methyltransferase
LQEEQTSSIVHWRLDAWFPEISKETHERFKKFRDELMKFNKSVNLISVKTIFHADVIHFADSIIASKIIQENNPSMTEIYDFGSGNGFPGIIFAMLYPNVKVCLVDSDQRKCEFLKSAAETLNIRNISVKFSMIEALPANSVKFAMARGLSNISKSILSSRKVVPVGGVFYHLKGDNWSGEVGEIPTQLCSVWTPSLVKGYKLPVGESKFAVIRTDKIS